MDFYNFFKSFLGIPNSVPPNDFNSDKYKENQDGQDNLFRSEEEDESMGFHMFSNPLEMHRYFEQQMNEIMRAFGLPSDRSIFGDFFGNSNPMIEPRPPSEPLVKESLRDQYLKPGYETPQRRADSDIDDQLDIKDIDTILTDKNEPVTPYKPPTSQPRIFGQSISSRTVVKPDGTVETEKIVRDNQGNEERSVTCRKGDEEFTVITRTDSEGKVFREEKRGRVEDNSSDMHVWPNLDGIFKW